MNLIAFSSQKKDFDAFRHLDNLQNLILHKIVMKTVLVWPIFASGLPQWCSQLIITVYTGIVEGAKIEVNFLREKFNAEVQKHREITQTPNAATRDRDMYNQFVEKYQKYLPNSAPWTAWPEVIYQFRQSVKHPLMSANKVEFLLQQIGV